VFCRHRFVSIRIFLLAVALVVVGAGSGVVRAADGNADDLTRRALELRRSGDDESARPLLRQAYDASHTPRAAVQLGLCEQALGRWVEADAYLSEGMKADKDSWVNKNRPALETALSAVKSHIARVEVTGDPNGAEVLINGASVARLPMAGPVRVSSGELLIELRAQGYQPGSKSFHIEGGQYQNVVLRLEPTTAVAAAALPSAPADVSSPGTAPTTDAAAGPAWRTSLKWVAWGAAALGLGVGIYGTVHNGSLVNEFDGGCANDPNGVPHAVGNSKTESQCSDLKKRYESASHLGIGGFVAAGVLGAAGLVLFLTEPHPPEANPAVTFNCAPELASGRNGVTCAWRF
jgi:hypothetical protein